MKKNILNLTLMVMFLSLLLAVTPVCAAAENLGPAGLFGDVIDFLNPQKNASTLIVLFFGCTFVIIFDIVLNYKNWKASAGFGALVGVAFALNEGMMAWFAPLVGAGGFLIVGLLLVVAFAGMKYKKKRLDHAANISDVESNVFRQDLKAAGDTRHDIYSRIQKIQQQKAHINNLIAQKAEAFASASDDAAKREIMATITKYKKTLDHYDDGIESLKGQLEGIKLKERQMAKETSEEVFSQ